MNCQEDYIKKAAEVRPSERQFNWQRMEFYAFAHFSINTFTNREWGDGGEDPSLFNPEQFDAEQWVEVCKSAGMKGIILTCKHHDGFCLWPSRYTDYSVKSSPWRGGNGDVVREVSDACRKGGLKFGVYLSPWDRHEKTYGDSPAYNDYYTKQLYELLTGYGNIFCVWLDGACGEGPNGKKQIYDWDGYYSTVRKLQPEAVISVCGPDVRWCGNEAGHCRKSEWSVVPKYLTDAEKTMEKSQKEDDREFAKRIGSMDEDLGSRDVIREAGELVWYPAEVNTSIRPGWFYHEEEDDKVKTAEELLDIYYKSVGGNANFLLNVPPDRRGLIHENDALVLKELGRVIKNTFSDNLAKNADVRGDGAFIEIDLKRTESFDRIVLMESIMHYGQRVESFMLEMYEEGEWRQFYEGTVIGYKRICCFNKIKTRYIRLRIAQSRLDPAIAFFGVYKSAAGD